MFAVSILSAIFDRSKLRATQFLFCLMIYKGDRNFDILTGYAASIFYIMWPSNIFQMEIASSQNSCSNVGYRTPVRAYERQCLRFSINDIAVNFFILTQTVTLQKWREKKWKYDSCITADQFLKEIWKIFLVQ